MCHAPVCLKHSGAMSRIGCISVPLLSRGQTNAFFLLFNSNSFEFYGSTVGHETHDTANTAILWLFHPRIPNHCSLIPIQSGFRAGRNSIIFSSSAPEGITLYLPALLLLLLIFALTTALVLTLLILSQSRDHLRRSGIQVGGT